MKLKLKKLMVGISFFVAGPCFADAETAKKYADESYKKHNENVQNIVNNARKTATFEEVIIFYAKEHFGGDTNKAFEYLDKKAPGLLDIFFRLDRVIVRDLREAAQTKPQDHKSFQEVTRAMAVFLTVNKFPGYEEKKLQDSKK